MIGKIPIGLWKLITSQKDLDKQCDMLIKANISQKRRENLFTVITWAKIIYGIWELALITLALIFTGIYVLLSL